MEQTKILAIIVILLAAPAFVINLMKIFATFKKGSHFKEKNYRFVEKDDLLENEVPISASGINFTKTYPSHSDYKGSFRNGTTLYLAIVKESGILFQYKSTNRTYNQIKFGIRFRDIKSITYEEDKSFWHYGQFIIIKAGDRDYTEEIIITSNNCLNLLDEIRMYYTGDLIGC